MDYAVLYLRGIVYTFEFLSLLYLSIHLSTVLPGYLSQLPLFISSAKENFYL